MAKKTGTSPAFENLTMGEIATVEDLSGMAIDTLAKPDAPKSRMFMALAVVILRRENPKTTLADVEKLSFTEIAELVGLDA